MKRTEILCPNCMKKKLLDTQLENEKKEPILRCDECGTEFYQTDTNTVEYR